MASRPRQGRQRGKTEGNRKPCTVRRPEIHEAASVEHGRLRDNRNKLLGYAGFPNNVSLRQLRAFDEVARQGAFAPAARELCLTQSALSESIRQLEDALGLRLLTAPRELWG